MRSASGLIIAVNVVLFLAMMIFSPHGYGYYGRCGVYFHMSDAKYIVFGAQAGPLVSCGEWYRIITAMFVHGGIIHLLFNMYALYYLGRAVEFSYGVWRFLVFYFASGIVGNIATQIFYYRSISLGASGAIFGLAGVLLAAGFRSDTPFFMRDFTGIAILPMVIFNIVYGFIPGSGINNAAHIGGLLTGMLFGYFSKPSPYPVPLSELFRRASYPDFWKNPFYRQLRRELLWAILGLALTALVVISFILLVVP